MNPFDTTGFPSRWSCGLAWTEQPWVGWLHIFSDIIIFLAYYAVPLVVLYYVRQRDDLKLPPIFYGFLGLIFFSCGTVHLIEAGIFWWPVYKLSGFAKLLTAVVSASGVVVLAKVLPSALNARSGAAYAEVVDERRKTEEMLKYEQFLLQTLLTNMPDFIYFKDKESRFTRVSDSIAEFFGVDSPESIIGKTDRDFFPEKFAVETRAEEIRLMKSGAPLIGKEELDHTTDGENVWLSATKLPLRDESGEVIGMFGLSRDITPQKKAAEIMAKAKQVAEDASRAKSEFLANMSHEIRTPMNGIMGMTELLLATELKRQQREYVDLINLSADSLLTVITDILDFSKIEAGKLHLDFHEFDLRDSIGDTLQTLGLRANEKNLELAYQVQSNVPDSLVGDIGRIRQVLVNLVGNALKFTKEGEVVVDVRLESQTAEGVVLHFFVQDTGIGITPEKQQDIFKSFTQAESTTTRIYGGTGLGLTISKKLVELMGGRIWVESQSDQGSTFHFTLLLGLGAEKGENLSSISELKGRSVLVVDDNKTNRKILEEILSNWAMLPQTADSGAQALEKIATANELGEPFPLILLDMMMPKMDGLEVARRVREQYGQDAPDILVITSAGHSTTPAEAEELGIKRVLAKPVKQRDLLDAISRLFGISTPAKSVEPRPTISRHSGIKPMKVLLVEDGRVNQILAIRLLEDRGHTVEVAEDGQVAIDSHAQNSFDAILMDLQMPRLDGLGATKVIRERELATGEHIPIIAMTANAMKGDREKCLAAGMDDYIAKPVRSNELFTVLEKYAISTDE
ncbi:MAG: hybrid sensor histidine kinase/response regulator [Blastopirellula sp.]|nr:MAG: hybrid sensor histidine kinase/response regulator [Blastopirellula sp.]